jgi:tetratricopeptide (TPR) repeat protein
MFRFSFFTSVSLAAAVFGGPVVDLDREIILTPQDGTSTEDATIRHAQERAALPAATVDDFSRLGSAYVAKARRTLDAGYYKLAEKCADAMDAQFGATTEARRLRAQVFHNLHRFKDAEDLARQLVEQGGEPGDFGMLSDALMEQGRLAEAASALQRMVDQKPGIESYARIAHLRWLKGDLDGAVAAMEMAARAISPRDVEPFAWALSRLSGYFLQQQKTEAARRIAEVAIAALPDYPPALLACGRALLAQGESGLAVAALRRGAELNPLPEYQWWYADSLRVDGQEEAATKVEATLSAGGTLSDPRTYALFLATRGQDADLALRLCREELANRADPLTRDALAWAHFSAGDFDAADAEIRKAMVEGTQDARLFFHAAEIARVRGETKRAQKLSRRARDFSSTLTPSELRQLNADLPHET